MERKKDGYFLMSEGCDLKRQDAQDNEDQKSVGSRGSVNAKETGVRMGSVGGSQGPIKSRKKSLQAIIYSGESFCTKICARNTLIAAVIGVAVGLAVSGATYHFSSSIKHKEEQATAMADDLRFVLGVGAAAGLVLGVGLYLGCREFWRRCGAGGPREVSIGQPLEKDSVPSDQGRRMSRVSSLLTVGAARGGRSVSGSEGRRSGSVVSLDASQYGRQPGTRHSLNFGMGPNS